MARTKNEGKVPLKIQISKTLELGSYAAAAAALGLHPSTVWKRLQTHAPEVLDQVCKRHPYPQVRKPTRPVRTATPVTPAPEITAEKIVDTMFDRILSFPVEMAVLQSKVVELTARMQALSLENTNLQTQLKAEQEYRQQLDEQHRGSLLEKARQLIGRSGD